jgi:predicted MFS family arabinose efflux permease
MRQDGRAVPARRALSTYLPIVVLTRTVVNLPFRVVYPFLPSLARGLGVSLAAAGGLITLRLVAGLAAPLLGWLADSYGRRRMMTVALLALAVASLSLSGGRTVFAAGAAFFLYGIAKALYDPAVYAYLGDVVPYRARGRATGIVELSWSAAWLLGVPASGFLIERFGWRAPWAALVGLGLLGAGLIRVGLAPSAQTSARAVGRRHALTMIATWARLLSRRPVRVLLLTNLLFMLAIEIPFIVYGAWLEATFGLSITALGLASTVVGLAEAAAEFGTTMLTDRLGKQRSVLIGLLGLAASLVALPGLAGRGMIPALAGVVLMMLSFEFGWVSLLPLATELAPDARATLLSLNRSSGSLGRILGAFAGGWLWQWHAISLNAGVGVACALVAALLLARGLPEEPGELSPSA